MAPTQLPTLLGAPCASSKSSSSTQLPTLLGVGAPCAPSKEQQHSGLLCVKPQRPPTPPLKLPEIVSQLERPPTAPSKFPDIATQLSCQEESLTRQPSKGTIRCPLERLNLTGKVGSGLAGGVSSAPGSARREYSLQSENCSGFFERSAGGRRRRPSRPLQLQDKLSTPPPTRCSSPQPKPRRRAFSLPSVVPIPARRMRHGSLSSESCSIIKSREPRDVALIRIIIAEARRRHVNRPAFQERLAGQQALQAEDVFEYSHSERPTLWKLRQAPIILREAMLDVLGSVKACFVARACLQEMQKRVDDRRERDSQDSARVSALWQRVRQQMPKLVAAAAFSKLLKDIRTERATESRWRGLASTINRDVTPADVEPEA